MSRGLFALIALAIIPLPAAAQRLPGNVVPEHYSLWFAPDLEKETFRGQESIRVVLTEPTNTITLHAAEIEFGEVTVTSGGKTQTARVTTDVSRETATLTVPQQLSEGQATIQVSYTGTLNEKLRGFYISRANGRKYAVTQMEATDARRAFPSFDEPIYKATFDVSVMLDDGDTVISNGRQISDTKGPEPGKHTVTFARTPKMSSYLVAMVVGDFVCREGKSDGIVIRICSTPDKRDLTSFALEAAEHQVKFFNDYFGIKYPFGKLDLIAVPDFAAGAMENAGAITFRERLLLIDAERSSIATRKNVASVIAHEIAHQWFGNLVTMKWWDDIWLNEGFATWMEKKPLAAWRPDWRIDLDETQDTQSALALDALRSTRPIRLEVETPEEINQVFDGIAYEKTAGVLRMIEAFVGRDAFRKAVSSYLKRYAYANAAGEDFWTELARVTGRPVDRILKSYVDQPGAPVLALRNKCVAGSNEITVTQDRFFGTPGESPASAQTWALPLCVTTSTSRGRCEMIDRREHVFTIPGCGDVFANAEGRGYYLTEYAPESLRTLPAGNGGLKPAERLSLLSDEWWMVRGGRHGIDLYLNLAAEFAADDDSVVTAEIARRLETIGEDLVDSTESERYQSWIRSRVGPALRELGLPGAANDSDERLSRRAALLGLVGITGDDPDVQRRARELAVRYMSDRASLPGTLVTPVLRVAGFAGDMALYEQYLAELQKPATPPEEYYRFFNALSWFRDPALTQRTLEFALSAAVRTQDTGTMIAYVMARPWSREAAWAFTRVSWPRLVDKLGTFQGIPAIISSFGTFCSSTAAGEVKAFFAKNPVPSSERPLQQAVERIESCAALKATHAEPLRSWLAAAR